MSNPLYTGDSADTDPDADISDAAAYHNEEAGFQISQPGPEYDSPAMPASVTYPSHFDQQSFQHVPDSASEAVYISEPADYPAQQHSQSAVGRSTGSQQASSYARRTSSIGSFASRLTSQENEAPQPVQPFQPGTFHYAQEDDASAHSGDAEQLYQHEQDSEGEVSTSEAYHNSAPVFSSPRPPSASGSQLSTAGAQAPRRTHSMQQQHTMQPVQTGSGAAAYQPGPHQDYQQHHQQEPQQPDQPSYRPADPQDLGYGPGPVQYGHAQDLQVAPSQIRSGPRQARQQSRRPSRPGSPVPGTDAAIKKSSAAAPLAACMKLYCSVGPWQHNFCIPCYFATVSIARGSFMMCRCPQWWNHHTPRKHSSISAPLPAPCICPPSPEATWICSGILSDLQQAYVSV